MTPKISTVIPTFNRGEMVVKCVQSVLDTGYPSLEVIVVDDCSPDDSRAKLEKVLAKYPERNVRILTHERNCGLPSARKTGFEASSGRYIYHCDGDDWVEKDILEKMYRAAVENEADYVYCDFYLTFSVFNNSTAVNITTLRFADRN